ncbi:MAG: HsdR family type I site-specific deoxyribonuclease [Spirochaetota bacterium]
MRSKKTNSKFRLDERNFVEKPLLEQLKSLGWEVLDLTDKGNNPAHSHRESYSEVVLLPILKRQLKAINPWLQQDQIEDVCKEITSSLPGNSLLKNNRHILQLLLENTTASENRETGDKSPTVRYIDFGSNLNNHFLAICQFKLRILGTEHHIIPDIVLFINGLPVVVIECKSPKEKDAIPQAIEQLMRYSEQRGERGEGSPKLFYYNQIIIATCRQQAKFGTISTNHEKQFYRWADPYPKTVNDLEHNSGSPNDQQRLVAGMLDTGNLLDIIQTYTLFSSDSKGQMIKIVGRYQQFRAVKLATRQLMEGKTPRERSGIVWHTQGSGKSLTMMFMVREMYRHAVLAHWKVVFVTDRTQLEEQLTETSQSIGYNVKVATSIAKLKEYLRTDTSDLVMAMIHKFRDADLKQIFPELNTSPHILVMTDEAHRSQYKTLGANLEKGIPNATRIGYTGTPIDKTERVFGDYIDKYTMRQAIEDGVTLEIVYEGRTHNAEVTDSEGMDNKFADVFSEYKLAERLQILGYGSRKAYLEAKATIKHKAYDMVEHYLMHVYPNGYKAQVVAVSREAAVRYKKWLDASIRLKAMQLSKKNPTNLDVEKLRKIKTDVIISGEHNDLPHLKKYANAKQQEKSIKSFKMNFDAEVEGITGDVGILIVNNKLITGFDAPIEQVMYLDRIITEHNLLQAIARVNRVSTSSKEKGYIVDYVGIGHHLKKAIDSYDEREQSEILDVITFPEEEIRQLNASYAAIQNFFTEAGITDITDLDAFYDTCYEEDIRFEFIKLFKELTRNYNAIFPSKYALDYKQDYQSLVELNVMAERHFHDSRFSMRGIPPKLRAIADVYLRSKNIQQKVKPISILDDDFQKHISKRKRIKTKAAAVEHAIRHHLEVEIDDPDLEASFAEALAKILEEFKDNWKKIYEELEKLREAIKKAKQEPTYGLHRKKQMPFFRSLHKEIFAKKKLDDDEISKLVDLTQQIFIIVERELKLVGFWESIPARNRLKAEIQKIIMQEKFTTMPQVVKNRQQIISRIMEIAERNHDTILYAS